MRVKVYAPGFCEDHLIDGHGMMEVGEGTTVKQVLKMLKTPTLLRNVLIVAVNYKRAPKHQVLQEGDVLSIMGPLSSG